MANKKQYLTHVDLWRADGSLLAAAETVTDGISPDSIGYLLGQGYIELYVAPVEGQEGE